MNIFRIQARECFIQYTINQSHNTTKHIYTYTCIPDDKYIQKIWYMATVSIFIYYKYIVL